MQALESPADSTGKIRQPIYTLHVIRAVVVIAGRTRLTLLGHGTVEGADAPNWVLLPGNATAAARLESSSSATPANKKLPPGYPNGHSDCK